MQSVDMIICGVGGQGNMVLERILGQCALSAGLLAKGADTFGAAQRGGSVLSHLRMGPKVASALVPVQGCHVLVGMEPVEALRSGLTYLHPDGMVIVNTAPVETARIKAGKDEYPDVDKVLSMLRRLTRSVFALNATEMAIAAAGVPRAMNMVMAGVLSGVLSGANRFPIPAGQIREVIVQTLPKGLAGNLRAFDAGYDWGRRASRGAA